MHFGGIYGDMDEIESSIDITTNPMDTSIRKAANKGKVAADKNLSKQNQYEELKRFYEKNKDKYSDEEDIRISRKYFLVIVLPAVFIFIYTHSFIRI